MVFLEPGSRRTHLGVAITEAAAAAHWIVGLQVKCPRAASVTQAAFYILFAGTVPTAGVTGAQAAGDIAGTGSAAALTE